MTKLKKVICLGLAALLLGGGLTGMTKAEKVSAATKALIVDGSVLTSTKTTADTNKTYSGCTTNFVFSSGAKKQSITDAKKFSGDAILIGTKDAYIYNSTAMPGVITKFEYYVTSGASGSVEIAFQFGSSAITSYTAGSAVGAGKPTKGDVTDLSSHLTNTTTFFRMQVTNSYNVQIEFRITYDIGTQPTVTVEGDSDVMMGKTTTLTHKTEDITSPGAPTWASSAPGVATVDSNGVVTPVSEGTTNITAKVNDTTSEAHAIKVWKSNANVLTAAQCVEVATFAGSTNSPFKYRFRGEITNISGSTNKTFTLSDGVGTVNAYVYSNGIITEAIVGAKIEVEGSLQTYNSTTQFAGGPTLKPLYNVTFSTNGVPGTPVEYAKGDKVVKPGDPTPGAGFSFIGWVDSEGTAWDFDNNTVSADITLTAKFANTALADALDATTTNVAAGYKYTTDAVVKAGFEKLTYAFNLHVGDQIIITSIYNDVEYTVSGTNDGNGFADGATITATNNISDTDAASLAAFTVEEGSVAGKYALSIVTNDGKKYLKYDGANISLVDAVTENTDCYVTSSGESFFIGYNDTRGIFMQHKIASEEGKDDVVSNSFKCYATSNLGATPAATTKNNVTTTLSYATAGAIYVKSSQAIKSYSDGDFRFNLKANGLDAVAAAVTDDADAEYGIKLVINSSEVTTNTVRYYNVKGQASAEKVIKLGDILNHLSRVEDEFTICAYAKYNGEYYSSSEATASKTFSYKSVIKAYYAAEGTKDLVTPLYDIFVLLGVNMAD